MCAIFGIAHNAEASNLTYLGLHALQHRGQEGAGIVSVDRGEARVHRRRGLVAEVFSKATLAKLKGHAAIGHTRYSTTGANTDANLQPILMKSALGWMALSHNGNLVNAPALVSALESQGAIFQSTNDTEVIIHLMARSKKEDITDALIAALQQVEGAYSLLLLTPRALFAVRDPMGFRPLVMGDLDGSPVFASESTAFDLIGAKMIREVEPAEIVKVSLDKPSQGPTVQSLKSWSNKQRVPRKRCVFEYVYFARPDSQVFGHNVYALRKALGRRLAEEHPAPHCDMVIPVPDSGVPAAIGYAEKAGLPFDMGIIRSHYIGRTFIEPRQSIRDFGVKLKLNPVAQTIAGKKIVVIDDSLVRGTTSKKLIRHLREAGAREIHLRISAPPTTHSCFYGIDTPTRDELLAANRNLESICEYVGADSLGYLSLEGLLDVATEAAGPGFCDACFSGAYPTAI